MRVRQQHETRPCDRSRAWNGFTPAALFFFKMRSISFLMAGVQVRERRCERRMAKRARSSQGNARSHVVCNHVRVSSSLHRVDAVHKAHLTKRGGMARVSAARRVGGGPGAAHTCWNCPSETAMQISHRSFTFS